MNTEELIVRYLSDSGSKEENVELLRRISENEDAMALFKENVTAWNSTHTNVEATDRFNADSAYAQFIANTGNDKTSAVSTGKERSMKTGIIMKTAASIAIIIGLFIGYNALQKNTELIEYTTQNDLSKVTLPDGTTVILNKNALLQAPSNFEEEKREVIAKGEMFFDVAKNQKKPFIIDISNIKIQVLGTSFVLSNDLMGNVSLILESGIVEAIHPETNETIQLSPGEKLSYIKETGTFEVKTNTDLNYNSWKTGILKFRNASFTKVIKDIEDHYNVSVNFDENKLNSCNLTATFDNQALEDVFAMLKLTFNVDIITQPSGIILIEGEGC